MFRQDAEMGDGAARVLFGTRQCALLTRPTSMCGLTVQEMDDDEFWSSAVSFWKNEEESTTVEKAEEEERALFQVGDGACVPCPALGDHDLMHDAETSTRIVGEHIGPRAC